MATPLSDTSLSFELLKEYIDLHHGGLFFQNLIVTSVVFLPLLYFAYLNRQFGFYLTIFFIFGFHRKLMPFLPSFFSPKVALLAVIWLVTLKTFRDFAFDDLKGFLRQIRLGDAIVILFFLLFVLSVGNAYSLGQTRITDIFYPVLGIIVFVTFRYLIVEKNDYFRLLKGIIITLHVHLIYSIFFSDSAELRMDGVVGKNSSAFIMSICLAYFLSFLSQKSMLQNDPGKRIMWEGVMVFYFILTGLVVFGLGSRSGFVLFAIASFFMVLSQRAIFKVSILGFLIGLLALPLLLTQLDKKTFVAEKLLRTFVALVNFETPPDTSSLDRIAVWETYLSTKIPPLGLGPGGFRKLIEPLASENFYLQTSAELGMIALVVLIIGLFFLLIVAIKEIVRTFRNEESAEFHFWVPSLVAVISLTFYGFFNDLLFQTYVWLLWGVLLGVYYRSLEHRKS